MTRKRFVKLLMQFNNIGRGLANRAANFCWYSFGSYGQAIENISRHVKDFAVADVRDDDDFDKLSLEQKNIYLNKKVEEYVKLYIENVIIPYGVFLQKHNFTYSKIKFIDFPVSENITTYKLPHDVKKFTDKDRITNLCTFFSTYIYLVDTKTDLMMWILYEADKEDLYHFRYNDGCIVLSKDSIQKTLGEANNLKLCVLGYSNW